VSGVQSAKIVQIFDLNTIDCGNLTLLCKQKWMYRRYIKNSHKKTAN